MQQGIGQHFQGLNYSPQLPPADFDADPAPQSDTRYFRLRQQRLAYQEYGSPAGKPIVYFHDSGSSRLEAAFFDEACRLHGYRLIAVDRPGIGESDYYDIGSPRDFCDDVLALTEHLGLQRFGVMSLGAGGIFGLHLAHDYPQKVSFKLCLAGVPGSVFNESETSSYAATCWNELTPVLIKLMVRIKHRFFPDDPGQFVERLQRFLSYTDRKVLADPEVYGTLALDQQEALRNGYKGVAQDLAVCFRKLDFRLSDVHVPTVIWQGEADRLSQRSDCEYMAARLPDVRYHLVPNKGHFFFIHRMDRVFEGLRDLLPRQALGKAA